MRSLTISFAKIGLILPPCFARLAFEKKKFPTFKHRDVIPTKPLFKINFLPEKIWGTFTKFREKNVVFFRKR